MSNFAELYKIFFGQDYKPDVYVKDVTIKEYVVKVDGKDGQVSSLGFNTCSDNCNLIQDDRFVANSIDSKDIKIEIYNNIVYVNLSTNTKNGITYAAACSANGAANIGNLKDSDKCGKYKLVGIFIITPPSHGLYTDSGTSRGDNINYTIPENIKASSILIYESIEKYNNEAQSKSIYIGQIMYLEEDIQESSLSPEECLYTTLLRGIYTTLKGKGQPLKNKVLKEDSTTALHIDTLDNIFNKSEKAQSCMSTARTSINLNHFTYNLEEKDFYTWLDVVEKKRLFWIAAEEPLKIPKETLEDFITSISTTEYLKKSTTKLLDSAVRMTKPNDTSVNIPAGSVDKETQDLNPNGGKVEISHKTNRKLTIGNEDDPSKSGAMEVCRNLLASNNKQSTGNEGGVVLVSGRDGADVQIDMNQLLEMNNKGAVTDGRGRPSNAPLNAVGDDASATPQPSSHAAQAAVSNNMDISTMSTGSPVLPGVTGTNGGFLSVIGIIALVGCVVAMAYFAWKKYKKNGMVVVNAIALTGAANGVAPGVNQVAPGLSVDNVSNLLREQKDEILTGMGQQLSGPSLNNKATIATQSKRIADLELAAKAAENAAALAALEAANPPDKGVGKIDVDALIKTGQAGGGKRIKRRIKYNRYRKSRL
jgi:hypothetical protein